MAIRFECECGKRLSVPDERAGKRVRCPGCGKPVSVPGGAEECGTPTAECGTEKRPDTSSLPLSSSLHEFLKGSVGDVPTVVLKRPDDDLAGVRELIGGPEAPDHLGRYPALGSLGRGGMGEVLLVRDPEIGRELAAKVILGGTFPDRKALEKLLVEAQVTGQLEHPNIVPVHELDIAPDGRVYFTMKRVRGKDLEKALAEDQHSLVRLLEVFLKACDAVAFAHARGVIHRDLKPANVMVGEFGEVLVMDWGLAKVFGHSDAAAAHVTPDLAGAQVARKARGSKGDRSEPLEAEPLRTQDGSVMGTPAYMPPEQAAGEIERLSERSDVYSLGAILYQMLTLFPPFTGGSAYAILQRVIEGKFVRPSERAPGRPVPRELEAAVLKAMAKDPAKRYASVAGLRADIEAYLAGRTLAAARYKPWQRAAKWVMRNKAVTAVSAAAAVVLVAASAGFMWKILVEKGRAEENARVAGENAAAEREARQEAERLQRVAEEKARREGDYALLDQYRSAAEGLWPAWPDQVEDMNEWTRGARDLASRLDEHRSRLDTMPAGTSSDLWARDNQTKLVAGLLELREKTIPDVEARTLRGREVGRAAQEHREDWERAIRRIADSPLYGGLVIALQTALVPLGPDPESGLWEFADIQTGLVPERGPDGKLAITEKTGVVLVLLPGGTFWMGAAPRGARNVDPSAQTDEGPVHEVTLEPFFMGKHEMTQGQWERVTGENPSFCKPGVKFGDKTVTLANPVEQVSWEDCDRWLGRLGLVLPTEAQWEYAARAGTQTVWWTGNEKETFAGAGNIIDSNCKRNGGTAGRDYEAWLDDGHTAHAPAGIFRANAFGLADTMGNVWEWCRDVYAADSYQTHPRDRDGLHGEEEAPTASAARSYRGGSWADLADYARSADRFRAASGIRNTDLGVRPARVLASGQ